MRPRTRALTLKLGVEAICGNLEKPRAKKAEARVLTRRSVSHDASTTG